MLDPFMRRLIDPPLNGVAAIWPRKISANQITIFGLVLGVACFLAIAINTMTAALILLALNRLADGLDGAVARAQTPSELGAYLDIVSDFVLWGLLPIGFIILDSDNAIAAAVLLSSFSMSMTVFSPSRLWPKSADWKPTRKELRAFSMLPALLKVQKPSRFSPLSLSGRVRLFRRLLSMRALCICLSSGGSPAAISF